MTKIGATIYFVIADGTTGTFSIRQQAREWAKETGGVLIPVKVSTRTQNRVQSLVNSWNLEG